MAKEKNLLYYSEVMLVTILSLIAASFFIQYIEMTLAGFHVLNPLSLLIVAIVTSVLSVLFLAAFFSQGNFNLFKYSGAQTVVAK